MKSKESLSEIRERKKALRSELVETKNLMNTISATMDKLKKSAYYGKLIEAGKIVESAGLLDKYNSHNLYLILQYNSDFICAGNEERTNHE